MNKLFTHCPRFIVLLLGLCILQAYALPVGAVVPSEPIPGQTLTGRITVGGTGTAKINNVDAHSGDTIFSGQTIQTPADACVTITLPGVGRVEISPGSTMTVSFSAGQITVSSNSGCVILTTESGVVGTVQMQGKTEQTNSATSGVLDVCAGEGGAQPVFGQGAAAAKGAGCGSAGAAVKSPGMSPILLAFILGGAEAGVAIGGALIDKNRNAGIPGSTPVSPSSLFG